MEKKENPTYKLNIKKHLAGLDSPTLWLMYYAKVSRPTAVRLAKDEGVKIELSTLRKLSDALDVPVQDLFVPVN